MVNLLLTDPPYGVDYTGKTGDALKIDGDAKNEKDLEKLLTEAFHAADLMMAPGAGFYVWHASTMEIPVIHAMENIKWTRREQIIWNKNRFCLGRSDYQWKHEPCYYGWKEKAPHYFTADRTRTTVIDCERPNASEEHPTMKPIKLFDELIRNSTRPGDVVLDLFGGSGTTLLACEQNGRKCLMTEISPQYCSVIIRRWENLTGKKAEKIENG